VVETYGSSPANQSPPKNAELILLTSKNRVDKIGLDQKER